MIQNNDPVDKIAHSLSVQNLVKQVISSQKDMRRSAVLLITFTFICTALYLPVPGVSGISWSSILGIEFDVDNPSLRILASIILLSYIIIFGTNYYKGLMLTEEAYESINDPSNSLDEYSRKNYRASLSDNYLFDAMRRLVNANRSDEVKSTESKDGLSDTLHAVHGWVRYGVAFGVVLIFISLVLFGEGLVIIGLTEMGTQINNNGDVELSTFGFVVNTFVSFVFAILSYLFFSYIGKQLVVNRNNVILKNIIIIIPILWAGGQFTYMGPIALQGSENLTSLHYGCRIGEGVKFDDEGKKISCEVTKVESSESSLLG